MRYSPDDDPPPTSAAIGGGSGAADVGDAEALVAGEVAVEDPEVLGLAVPEVVGADDVDGSVDEDVFGPW